VNDVSQWLNSLHVAPTSANTVDITIAEQGFNDFGAYQIEYTTANELDQWTKVIEQYVRRCFVLIECA
jgi:hypothetical protein